MIGQSATSASEDLAWQPAFRAEFPLLKEVAYFQTGSEAPLSRSVRTAIIRTLDVEGDTGLAGQGAFEELCAQIEAVRAHLATFLGVQPVELGWTHNTSTANRYPINSIHWQPGDVLITSSTEHISTRNLREGLAQRHGVRNVIVPVEDGDDRFLEELERTLDREQRARLLMLSHVSCRDGRRLPVAAASRLAQAHGVLVFVDGAQAVGQFPIDIAEIGCDFYSGSAHKWILGPAGLGYLYVAAARLDEFAPDFIMAPFDRPPAPASAGGSSRAAARQMEIGTESFAIRAGLAAALSLLDRVGLATVERYVARLSARLQAGLRALPGIGVLTPPGDQAAGITSFAVPGNTLADVRRVVDGLWQETKVVAKVQPEHPAVRVSIAAFNTEEDVDLLLLGLARILRTIGL